MNFKDFYKANKWHGEWQNRAAVRALKPVDWAIYERAKVQLVIDKYSENSKIGVLVSGMDCDCTSFSYGFVTEASIRSLIKTVNSKYDDAEGPMNIRFCKPTQAKQTKYESRDLALEAFEEGHAHVVYY